MPYILGEIKRFLPYRCESCHVSSVFEEYELDILRFTIDDIKHQTINITCPYCTERANLSFIGRVGGRDEEDALELDR